MKKPHWIETENHKDLIEPLTDLKITLSEGYHGEVMKANLIFDIGVSKEIAKEREHVAIRLIHNDEGYHIDLYDGNPDKELLLKKIEQKMNEEMGRKFKIFFDRNDTFPSRRRISWGPKRLSLIWEAETSISTFRKAPRSRN